MYHSFPYFYAKMVVSFLLLSALVILRNVHFLLLSTMMIRLLCGLHAPAESTIIYWMVGLRHDEWYYYFIFIFIMLITSWTGEVCLLLREGPGGGVLTLVHRWWVQALIFAVCNMSGGTQVAQAGVGLCLGFFFIFAGFYINTHSIPSYFIWAKYSSFIKVRSISSSVPRFFPLPPLTHVSSSWQYGFEALVYNEFVDRVINGVPGELIIDNTTQGLGLWVDVGILGGMAGFYLVLAYLALHFLHREKR